MNWDRSPALLHFGQLIRLTYELGCDVLCLNTVYKDDGRQGCLACWQRYPRLPLTDAVNFPNLPATVAKSERFSSCSQCCAGGS